MYILTLADGANLPNTKNSIDKQVNIEKNTEYTVLNPFSYIHAKHSNENMNGIYAMKKTDDMCYWPIDSNTHQYLTLTKPYYQSHNIPLHLDIIDKNSSMIPHLNRDTTLRFEIKTKYGVWQGNIKQLMQEQKDINSNLWKLFYDANNLSLQQLVVLGPEHLGEFIFKQIQSQNATSKPVIKTINITDTMEKKQYNVFTAPVNISQIYTFSVSTSVPIDQLTAEQLINICYNYLYQINNAMGEINTAPNKALNEMGVAMLSHTTAVLDVEQLKTLNDEQKQVLTSLVKSHVGNSLLALPVNEHVCNTGYVASYKSIAKSNTATAMMQHRTVLQDATQECLKTGMVAVSQSVVAPTQLPDGTTQYTSVVMIHNPTEYTLQPRTLNRIHEVYTIIKELETVLDNCEIKIITPSSIAIDPEAQLQMVALYVKMLNAPIQVQESVCSPLYKYISQTVKWRAAPFDQMIRITKMTNSDPEELLDGKIIPDNPDIEQLAEQDKLMLEKLLSAAKAKGSKADNNNVEPDTKVETTITQTTTRDVKTTAAPRTVKKKNPLNTPKTIDKK
jgi:hypothetical protein